MSSNFSMGVHFLRKPVCEAANALPNRCYIEIVETHHSQKKDAPSGTAFSILGDMKVLKEKNFTLFVNHGKSEHNPGEINDDSIPGEDVVVENEIYFFGQGERLEITHKAPNREIFVRGVPFPAENCSQISKPKLYTLSEIL
jgi:4-hydroxy-tetrahydrodipicolinate reductase